VEVVLLLLDSDGKQGDEKPLIGQAVEISGDKHYFRKQADFCDDAMAAVSECSLGHNKNCSRQMLIYDLPNQWVRLGLWARAARSVTLSK
jgi:hypothetical protein